MLGIDSELDRSWWIAILSISGVGQQTFTKIRTKCQHHQLSLGEWWARADQVESQAGFFGLDKKTFHHLREFKTKFTVTSYPEYLQEKQIQVVLEPDAQYPELLSEAEEKPLILFVKGSTAHWNVAPLAVVGTRKMTGYGELVTRLLVADLVNNGLSIISGGMFGVDMQAHQTALEQDGKTVAVLGFGFDHWYPEFDKKRGQALLAQGATFVTEFPPFVPPIKGNFPSRNRIVAGMSLGVLVTEAGLESGSHITAIKAVEYNREVFAVPGPITNPYSEGTKWLVNQGATLVTSADDVLTELGYRAPASFKSLGKKTVTELAPPVLHFDEPLEANIYQLIKAQPASSEELWQKGAVPIEQLTAVLSQLEMKGFLKKYGDLWMVT
jgi:DNA processing protein